MPRCQMKKAVGAAASLVPILKSIELFSPAILLSAAAIYQIPACVCFWYFGEEWTAPGWGCYCEEGSVYIVCPSGLGGLASYEHAFDNPSVGGCLFVLDLDPPVHSPIPLPIPPHSVSFSRFLSPLINSLLFIKFFVIH